LYQHIKKKTFLFCGLRGATDGKMWPLSPLKLDSPDLDYVRVFIYVYTQARKYALNFQHEYGKHKCSKVSPITSHTSQQKKYNAGKLEDNIIEDFLFYTRVLFNWMLFLAFDLSRNRWRQEQTRCGMTVN
jgi:hypothetical protein